MIWDRYDDWFDDERYGTPGELQDDIAMLEARLRQKGIPVPQWTPPWTGQATYTVAAQRAALFGRKIQLEKLLREDGSA